MHHSRRQVNNADSHEKISSTEIPCLTQNNCCAGFMQAAQTAGLAAATTCEYL